MDLLNNYLLLQLISQQFSHINLIGLMLNIIRRKKRNKNSRRTQNYF